MRMLSVTGLLLYSHHPVMILTNSNMLKMTDIENMGKEKLLNDAKIVKKKAAVIKKLRNIKSL